MKNFLLVFFVIVLSCNHKTDPAPVSPPIPPVVVKLDTIYTPVDPGVAASMGFFLDDWQPKTFTAPASSDAITTTSTPTDTINIDLNKVITKVPKYLFGNNVNSWMGQMVDGLYSNPYLMQYLTSLNPHILRFPGGSISDTYFWNSPVNTPPADVATTIYNAGQSQTVDNTYWWTGTHPTTDGWTISVDNYYKVLQQTNSTGIITVNYGYARYGTGPTPVQTAAHLAAQWVRHDNGRTKYWEIGNEDFGSWEAGYQIDTNVNQDGQPQIITGALYGQHFKVFADSMRKAAQDVGATIEIGAQVTVDNAGNGNLTSSAWNNSMFSTLGNAADFFIVHNYYSPYHANSSASVVLNSALIETKTISSNIISSAASNQVQMKPLAMTEWNIEAEGSKQKVSAVAGMHAVLSVGEMLTNGFGEATRWDLVNGWDGGNDHGLFNMSSGISSSGANPNESAWNPRPAYYYLYYMQKYLGDRLVTTVVKPSVSDLTVYSSTFTSGEAGIVIINKGAASHTALVNVNHFNPGTKYYEYNLTPGTDNGDFSGSVLINGNTASPLSYGLIKPFSASITSGSFKVSVPARSVLYLVVDNK